MLNLIDRLPRNSHFQQALALDEDYARAVAEYESQDIIDDAGEWRPPMSTYSAEVEAMILVANKLEHLATMVGNFMGGKTKPDFIKGPKTAIEEFRTRSYVERRQRNHERLVARLLPNKGKAEPPVG